MVFEPCDDEFERRTRENFASQRFMQTTGAIAALATYMAIDVRRS